MKQQGQKQGLRALLLDKSKNELVDLLCELAKEFDLMQDVYHLLGDFEDKT